MRTTFALLLTQVKPRATHGLTRIKAAPAS